MSVRMAGSDGDGRFLEGSHYFDAGANGGGGVPVASVADPPVMPTTGKGRGTSLSSPVVGKVGPEVMRAAIEGVKAAFTFRTLA